MNKEHYPPVGRWGAAALGCCLMVMLSVSGVWAQEARKFTLVNVIFDGTKIWLPSSLMVNQGDAVELTLINKLDEPHGFQIAAFGIEEVVQPKAQTTVKFTATKPGIIPFICQMHAPHIGGQILVVEK
jgi:nitrosocyanin